MPRTAREPSILRLPKARDKYALKSLPHFAQNVVMYKKCLHSGFCNIRSEDLGKVWNKSRPSWPYLAHVASSFGQNEESILCNVARWVKLR